MSLQRAAYSGDAIYLFSTADDPNTNDERRNEQFAMLPPNVRTLPNITMS
jgi:hypothetical protein